MIIVFEGMDNTGKTTAIEKMHTLFGFPIVKSLGKATKEEHEEWLINLVQRHNDTGHILVDRLPIISEYVYGPILRGENVLKDVQRRWLDELKPDMILVYCRPHRDLILGSLADRDQMAGVVDHGAALLQSYDDFMDRVRRLDEIPLIVYNYRVDPKAIELAGDIHLCIRGKE